MTARSVIATEGHAAVWAVREGKGVRVQLFPTWAEALEAAGLRDAASRFSGPGEGGERLDLARRRWIRSVARLVSRGDARIVERVRFVPNAPARAGT